MGENVTKLEESVAPGFLAVHFFTRKRFGGILWGFALLKIMRSPSLLGWKITFEGLFGS